MQGARPLVDSELLRIRNWCYRLESEKEGADEPVREDVPQDAWRSISDGVYADIATSTGLRLAEMLDLQWQDVFNFHTYRPRPSFLMQASRLKGRKRARRCIMNVTARHGLQTLFKHWCKLYQRAWPPFPEDPVFAVQHSDGYLRTKRIDAPSRLVPATPRTFQKRLKLMFARAGLDPTRLSSHSFRKTFCMRAYAAAEGDLRVTMEFTGHASLASLQRYLEVSGDALRAVQAQLEAG